MSARTLAALLGVWALTHAHPVRADFKVDDAIVRKAMEDELARAKNGLRIGDEPRPYYIAYTITDFEETQDQATFGAAVQTRTERERTLRVDMRVGDPKFDNSNFTASFSTTEWYWNETTVEDDYVALRRELWLRTDDAYRQALERLAAKRAAADRQAASEEQPPVDFLAAKPWTTVVPAPPERKPPAGALPPAELVVKLSNVFRDYGGIHDSRASSTQARVRRRFLSSEGTWIDDGSSRVQVQVNANTQAADGTRLWNEAVFRTTTTAGERRRRAPPGAKIAPKARWPRAWGNGWRRPSCRPTTIRWRKKGQGTSRCSATTAPTTKASPRRRSPSSTRGC
jgi:hypothetical protein